MRTKLRTLLPVLVQTAAPKRAVQANAVMQRPLTIHELQLRKLRCSLLLALLALLALAAFALLRTGLLPLELAPCDASAPHLLQHGGRAREGDLLRALPRERLGLDALGSELRLALDHQLAEVLLKAHHFLPLLVVDCAQRCDLPVLLVHVLIVLGDPVLDLALILDLLLAQKLLAVLVLCLLLRQVHLQLLELLPQRLLLGGEGVHVGLLLRLGLRLDRLDLRHRRLADLLELSSQLGDLLVPGRNLSLSLLLLSPDLLLQLP
mmetsp:Transcript_18651/g.40180  ORF Transcript_18651/g.40180 Transcript_18651/m.40180 type:complete len:264 (-) Transcript_18651:560-1351(-)